MAAKQAYSNTDAILSACFTLRNPPNKQRMARPPSIGYTGNKLYTPCIMPQMAILGNQRAKNSKLKLPNGPAITQKTV